jgi:hypothetical protein
MTDAAVIALELRHLRAAVEAQAVELAELRRGLMEKRDRRTGARLVPALGRLTQGSAFDLAGLGARVLNDRTPAGGVVREVMADHADADEGLRGFGRLLVRLRGVNFAGLRLEPVPGARWRVTGFQAE